MGLLGDDGEKIFLRDLVLRQQKQIESLEERIHALAEPIAAARISSFKLMAERAAKPPTDAEHRLGIRKRGGDWRSREDRPSESEALTDAPDDDGMPPPTRQAEVN